MYTVTPSNAIIATTFQGLSITRDNGCGWSIVGGDLDDKVFIDLSANPNDKKNVVVFASSYDKQDDAGKIFFASQVWETKDEGQTFQQLGPPMDSTILGYTIDLTKTDPNRIYASVVRNPGPQPQGILFTSKDHGAHWGEEAVPLINDERSFYIAAVDPNDAEKVYLRTYCSTTDKPTRLILREADPDGGAPTYRTVYNATGALQGFALSPDGSKVYIGGQKDGLKVASTADFKFEQRSTVEIQCLAISPDGLWACSNERMGFVAGLSTDDGRTFEPRLRFCDIGGPLASCGPGTATYEQCQKNWPTQKAVLGCSGDVGVTGDGGFEDAGPGFAPDKPAPKSSGGCGCEAAPAGPWGALAGGLFGAVALVRRARRKSK
jgi:MYXO-CTERM domain-containing protein